MSPVNVSNNLLKRSFDDSIDVSPMKLQKLLYFVASEYAKDSDTDLLSESFQPWQYGPVVRSVYDEFKSFRAAPIRKFAKDAQGKSYRVNEQNDPALKAALDRVWESAADMSAVQLSRITHAPGSAWTKAYEAGHMFISNDDLRQDVTYRARLNLDSGV